MRSRNAVAVLLLLAASACRTATPVGGMPVNFGVVEEGKLYRGGQPSHDEIRHLHDRGVRTIVKLNTADLAAERAAASELGIRLIEVPLNARQVGTSKACADVERAYKAMTDPANGPVYVHCDHGRDRTGFLTGLYRQRAQEWTFEQISDELSHYGHNAGMRTVFPNISKALDERYPACVASGE